MSNHFIVLVTCGSRQEAETIARDLVERRLAACVNLLPGVTSVYRWQGAIEADEEVLLIAKTQRARFSALAERVKELHSYDLPEVIGAPIEAGLQAYLDWIDEECTEAT